MLSGRLLSYSKKIRFSQNGQSLSLVVIRCHSSFVVPLVVPFVVIHCHSFYHSLSLDVPLVCLFVCLIQTIVLFTLVNWVAKKLVTVLKALNAIHFSLYKFLTKIPVKEEWLNFPIMRNFDFRKFIVNLRQKMKSEYWVFNACSTFGNKLNFKIQIPGI